MLSTCYHLFFILFQENDTHFTFSSIFTLLTMKLPNYLCIYKMLQDVLSIFKISHKSPILFVILRGTMHPLIGRGHVKSCIYLFSHKSFSLSLFSFFILLNSMYYGCSIYFNANIILNRCLLIYSSCVGLLVASLSFQLFLTYLLFYLNMIPIAQIIVQ